MELDDRSQDKRSSNDLKESAGTFFRRYAPPESSRTNESMGSPVPGDTVSSVGPPEEEFTQHVSDSETASAKFSGDAPTEDGSLKRALFLGGIVCIVLLMVGLVIIFGVNTGNKESNTNQVAGNSSGSNESNAVPDDVATEAEVPEAPESTEEEPDGDRVRIKRRQFLLSPQRDLFLLSNALSRGREFEERGMLSEAQEEYRAFLEKFPQATPIRQRLDRVENIITTERNARVAHADRVSGLAKFRHGDYVGAERDLSNAVSAGLDDLPVLYALGTSYLRLGRYSEAETVLGRCVTAFPDYAPALVSLAQVNMASGKSDRAAALLKRALELGGGAEFTPEKIKEMISGLTSKAMKPPEPAPSFFFSHVVHRHSFPITWCRGQLTASRSVIEFKSNKPSHSFRVLPASVSGLHSSGNEMKLTVSGKEYLFFLENNSPSSFIKAVRH